MILEKPAYRSMVKVTIDNSSAVKSSLVWQPSIKVIEGVMIQPNSWDEKDTIRLHAPLHSIPYPVISMKLIISIDFFGIGSDNSPKTTIDNNQEELKNEIIYSIKSSRTDEVYKVVKSDNNWSCNCFAGLRNLQCRHIKDAQELDKAKG